MQADIFRTLSTRAGLIIASISKILKFPALWASMAGTPAGARGKVEKYFNIKYIEII